MDAQVWAFFFAGVVSMRFHPGRREAPVDFDMCAEAADVMLRYYKERFPCPG